MIRFNTDRLGAAAGGAAEHSAVTLAKKRVPYRHSIFTLGGGATSSPNVVTIVDFDKPVTRDDVVRMCHASLRQDVSLYGGCSYFAAKVDAERARLEALERLRLRKNEQLRCKLRRRWVKKQTSYLL